MRKVVLAAIAVILLSCSPAFAQGPYLGAGFVYNSAAGSDIRYLRGGPGLEFTFGYNFGPLALEGNLIGSRHSDTDPGYGHADFGGLSIDLRIFLLPLVESNQVYLLAGAGSYSLYEYDPFVGSDTELRGTGWNAGAGVEHYFNQSLSFNASAVYRIIRYDEFDTGGFVYSINPHQSGDMVTIQAGILFYW